VRTTKWTRLGMAATTVVVGLGVAQPAGAWGSRAVSRSCGNNFINSYQSGGYSYAETQRIDGTCAGPLGAGIRTTGGTVSLVWGSASGAYTSAPSNGTHLGGSHYGCPGCSVSNT
jgi:hypothetical protein